jgi:TolA-binding protein
MAMIRTASVLVGLIASALMVAGCSPPSVILRHVMPGDLDLPAGAKSIAVGPCTVASGPAGTFGPMMAERLAKRLAELGTYEVRDLKAPAGPAADLVVAATLTVETRDETGTRLVRRLDPATQQTTQASVPTLLRTASVRADFVVTMPAGQRLGAAEVHARYSSSNDPRTRGPLGLDRPDDPSGVPATETIVGELIDQCAAGLVRMLAPATMEARVPMRPASGDAAQQAWTALGQGDFATAAKGFEAALSQNPDDANLRFNLAVCQEAAGDFRAARTNYQAVWDASKQQDREAQEGLKRVSHLIRD